ncbi:unnamed protein product [Trichobilharzia regenti]|nr:unnamed protein product [Trichobilharzia regenti]
MFVLIASVSSDCSSWVKSFSPTGNLPPKRHSSSRLTTTSGVQKISKLYEDQNCINISPPSSPEQDVLEFRHELLNIEDPFVSCSCGIGYPHKRLSFIGYHFVLIGKFPLDSELQQLQNLRSGHCSSSVVSQNEAGTICESSQPNYVTELRNTDEQTNLDSSFESLCYLTELQRDCAEVPYTSLNSILRKLHHLLKRKSSERCVWLHQRSTQRTQVSFNHVSKAFQILKVFRSPNGLSGLIAFGVREITSNLEAKIENQGEERKDESNCFGDPHTVLNCPNRFRGLLKRNLLVISEFEDSSQDVSATLFDRKCCLVLGCHRFWLLNKLRYDF